MAVIDPASHVVEFVNSTAARMFGAPADALTGRVCHEALCPADAVTCPTPC